MSWDVIIGKKTGTNYAKPAEAAGFLPMGKPNEVKAKLDASIPSIQWSGAGNGYARFDKFSFEINFFGAESTNRLGLEPFPLREFDDVHMIGTSARGSGDPVAVIVDLCKTNRWSAADSQLGEWINLNAPSRESWQQFSAYRDRAPGGTTANAPTSGSVAVNLLISLVFFALVGVVVRYSTE